MVMKSYVKHDNAIYVEEGIFKELFSQEGIAWKISLLLDAGQLQGPIIPKIFK